MPIEDRLKNYINSRYSSVNEFCDMANIPNSTLQTVFKRGIVNTSSKTIFKICDALSLDVKALYAGEIKSTKPEKKTKSDPVEIYDFISGIERANLTYQGEPITDDQKRIIITGARVATEIAMSEK